MVSFSVRVEQACRARSATGGVWAREQARASPLSVLCRVAELAVVGELRGQHAVRRLDVFHAVDVSPGDVVHFALRGLALEKRLQPCGQRVERSEERELRSVEIRGA